MAKTTELTPEDLSAENKILYDLLSAKIDQLDLKIDQLDLKIDSVEQNMTDNLEGFAKDLSQQLQHVKDDVNTIASVYGFVRNSKGKLHRPT